MGGWKEDLFQCQKALKAECVFSSAVCVPCDEALFFIFFSAVKSNTNLKNKSAEKGLRVKTG